jgi:methylenetetrahydrofolate reductase (NADPH)
MARYLRDRVPGMTVADEYIERMAGAVADIAKEDKVVRQEAWRAEGIRICVEQIEQVREIEGVAGVHIMAIEWEGVVGPIVEAAGLDPRPVL